MQIESGTKLGRYEILSEIGAGGMGLVYKAKDTTLDRTVAIKVLKPELVSNAQGFERFRREAKAIAGLSHPNIISLFDFGVENNICDVEHTAFDDVQMFFFRSNFAVHFGRD